jgi:tape measure domain-containing protein
MAQGKITREDIIDSGVDQAIKQLSEAISGIGKNFDIVIKKAAELKEVLGNDSKIKSFADLVSISDELEENIKNLIKNQKELNEALTSTAKTGAKGYDQLVTAIEALTKAMVDQKNAQNELNKSKRDSTKTSKDLTDQTKKEEKAKEDALKIENKRIEAEKKFQQELARRKITAQSYDVGSIQRLNAENKVLELQMRRLNPLIEEERIQFQKLTNEYIRNKNEIQRLTQEKQKSKQNFLGLKGVFGELASSVAKLGAAYFSLNTVVNLVKQVFRDTKELDKLKLIFKSFIKDTQELATTFEFLSDMASRYGLDLLNLSERYAKFRAATLASKLSLEDTRKIFDTFAKASAVLGLRTDEVRGVFLALEQMMSKGKVTTEELRRQLGERLPGAVNIMAKSMDKGTRELDAMLKKGQVISEEVLPKFAEMLEKVYGIENVQMIDTLAAAQGRMNKAWLDFVEGLNATDTFKESFNFITRFLADMNLYISEAPYLAYKYAKTYSSENVKIFRELDKLTIEQVEKDKKMFQARVEGSFSKDALNQYIEFRKEQEKIDRKSSSVRELYAKLDDEQLENRIDMLLNIKIKLNEQYQELNKIKIIGEGLSEDQKKQLEFLEEQNKETENHLSIAQKIQESRKEDLTYFESQLKVAKELFETREKLGEKGSAERVAFEGTEGTLNLGKTRTGQPVEVNVFEEGIDDYKAFLNKQLEIYKDNIEKRIIIRRLLYDAETKSTGGKKVNEFTSLEQAESNIKTYLDLLEKSINESQTKIIESDETTSEMRKSMEQQKNLEILNAEIQLRQDILDNLNLTEQERARINEKITDLMRQESEIRKGIAEDEVQFEINEQQRVLRQNEEDRKARLKMDETEAEISLANTILRLQEEATLKVTANKNNAKKVAEIEAKLGSTIMQEILKNHLSKEQLYADDAQAYREWELEKLRILEDIERAKREEIEKTSKATADQLQKQLQFLGESINTAFNVINDLRQEDMSAAEAIYNKEVAMAGTNVRAKIAAEEKLYNAKKNAARKAARIERAQALFNIGLNTAQAIIGIWAQVPKFDFGISAAALTAIVTALGAAQMAAVLAQPIPAYEHGGIAEGGTALVGEKGKELMIMPSGEKYLSPDRPSLLNLPQGTEIIPHDETQKILANAAKNNFIKETIDLSLTNNYLREIRDRETVNIVGNYKYVNKNGIKGRYAIGV